MFDCYDIKTNDCDGRCQGCCDCPKARGLKPSRRVMKSYMKYVKKNKEEDEKVIKELENDEEFMKEMKEILGGLFNKKERDRDECLDTYCSYY